MEIVPIFIRRSGHRGSSSGRRRPGQARLSARQVTWDGIPPEIADYLAELLAHETKRSEAVEVILGQHLDFFYQADKNWSEQFLLPRFDWSNESRARRLWDGYLSHGGWTDEVLRDGFMDKIVATVAQREKLAARRARNSPVLLGRVALEADIDSRSWVRNFLTTSSTDDHVAWSEAIAHQLRSLEPDLVETQWDRWIRDYLAEHIRSVPRRLDAREATAVAHWVLFLHDSMASAIQLLLTTEIAGVGQHSLFFSRS
jgi:hypothetical protein